VIVERPQIEHADIDIVFRQIEDRIRAAKPVLVSLEGKLSHYTVISGTAAPA
jgi:hypothetical protein